MENVLMDRIQFIGQAHKGRIMSTDELIAFFDHMMCAYDIVGVVDNTSIEGSTDNLQFLLKIRATNPDISEMEHVEQYVSNILHNQKKVYGKTFHIDASLYDSFVELDVRQI